MTTYVLAGSQLAAVNDAYGKGLLEHGGYGIVYVTPKNQQLEGRNILPGDAVLFAHNCPSELIEQFVVQAYSRGTRLSDLRIIHG